MSLEKIRANDVLRETFSILGREKELLLLLGAFLAAITLIFLWPLMEIYSNYFTSLSTDVTTQQQSLQQLAQNLEGVGYIYFAFIPLMFLQYGVMALWSRASILGRNNAFEGGVASLLKRSFWAFWRYICAFGWMLLLMIPLWVGLFVLFLVLGAGTGLIGPGTTTSGTVGLLLFFVIFIFYGVFFFAMIALMFLMSVSIHGEARDMRLPIHKSYKYLKGNLVRATGLLILLMIGFYVLYFFGLVLVFGAFQTSATWVSLIGIFAVMLLIMVFTLTSMTYGAIYASRLVPELKEKSLLNVF